MDKSDSRTSGPLWKGRIESAIDHRMDPLNRSLPLDFRLWPQDVRGSRAWANALAGSGIIEEAERGELVEGLDRVSRLLAENDYSQEMDEDIHSLVERLLYSEIGDLAGKLHTGRSRNDQVATDLRLWGLDAIDSLVVSMVRLEKKLLLWAEESVHIIFPGYTHLQQGQPVRAAHWVMSHFWPLDRDRELLGEIRKHASVLPLGSGAIAGCPFPIDRKAMMEELGFSRLSENSIDAVSDRDWVMELSFATARIGIHLSRLCEDLVLFTSSEFGFVRLGDGFSTGSSLMPQKRNPDVAELTRGKSGRLVGNLMSLMTILKGLPTGYNRDLQEDKHSLFDSTDTLCTVLPAIEGAVKSAEFLEDNIKSALNPELYATDLADHLVRSGVPFREAHEVIGKIVRMSAEQNIPLDEISLQDFQGIDERFGSNVQEVFSYERSVESRSVSGGTSLSAIKYQLEAARESVQSK
ncbi:MAG: argininosuccinate lyase [Gemmatimonadota bacterium]|nr:argininosuccinate lyase [Gemmatimonadota bacterium]